VGLDGASSAHGRKVEQDVMQWRQGNNQVLAWLSGVLAGPNEIKRLERRRGMEKHLEQKGGTNLVVSNALQDVDGKEIPLVELDGMSTLELREAHNEALGLLDKRNRGVEDVEKEMEMLDPHYQGEVSKWLTVLMEEVRLLKRKMESLEAYMEKRAMAIGRSSITRAQERLYISKTVCQSMGDRIFSLEHAGKGGSKEDPPKPLGSFDRLELHRVVCGMSDMFCTRSFNPAPSPY